MPEGLRHEPRLVTEAKAVVERARAGQGDYLHDALIKKQLVPLFPETEYVGLGTNVLVVAHPTKQDRVIAYGFEEDEYDAYPLTAVHDYHINRVLSILFPEHFPRWHAALACGSKLSIRQRVREDGETRLHWQEKARIEDEIKAKAAEIGLKIALDMGGKNLLIAEDGKRFYVDKVFNKPKHFAEIPLERMLDYYDSRKGNMGGEQAVEKGRRELIASHLKLRELAAIQAVLLAYSYSGKRLVSEQIGEIWEEYGFGNTSTATENERREVERSRKRVQKSVAIMIDYLNQRKLASKQRQD